MSNEPLADLRDMYMVHAMLRREFGLAPALIRGVADGDTERAAIVADHLQLIESVLDHHHRGEDAHVWPLLRQRAGTEVAPVVQLMEEQHGDIEKLLAELRARLAQWRGTAGSAQGEALADTAARLTTLLVEHLAVEEERAIPVMEQHITAAEWGRAVADGSADVSPELMPLLFGMMAYEGNPDTVREVIASMPPELSSAIGDLSSQAFAEHARQVHGTATPQRIGAQR
jgi:hemerythrin-like domain-containing protein